MLSNTAETNPSPSATCHEASGSLCTGIIDAASTNESRKIEPLSAPGNSLQAGRRSGTHTSSAAHTAAPMNGKRSDHALNFTLTTTFTTIAVTRMNATMNTRAPSMRTLDDASFTMGEYRCCCSEAGMPKITIAIDAAMYASSTDSGETPSIHIIVVVVSPTTLPEPPAFDAATMAAR